MTMTNLLPDPSTVRPAEVGAVSLHLLFTPAPLPLSLAQASISSAEQTMAVTTMGSLSLKIGTCEHCVIHEQGRPSRAWDAKGDDSELDFDRNALLTALAELGVEVQLVEQYVCP